MIGWVWVVGTNLFPGRHSLTDCNAASTRPIRPRGDSDKMIGADTRRRSWREHPHHQNRMQDARLPMTPHTAQSTHQRTAANLPSSLAGVTAVHLVGVCGSGMRSLAEYCLSRGWEVTGSDQAFSPEQLPILQATGLRVHRGHEDQFLPNETDLLVYSPAIPAANPERRMAARLGIPEVSYGQMLGLLMRQKSGISIAGTHGKSTTTAMTAWTLHDAGLEPSALGGGELIAPQTSGDNTIVGSWPGNGDFLVVESCEYQRTFLDVRPHFAVITGVEPDHFDCFQNFIETKSAFADFAANVDSGGTLLIRPECAASREVAASASADVETFSRQPSADWWASDLKPTRDGVRFRVFYHGWFFSEISLRLRGTHNVENALAAVAMCHYAGVDSTSIRLALEEFPGIRRRLEQVGSWRGVTLLDDYAHHPTAIRTTLATVREWVGSERRVWCVFQPHQVSRTKALMPEFAAAFTQADRVLIAPVFAARESAEVERWETASDLAANIAENSCPADFATSLDRITATLDDNALPGDVLLTMGAGDIDRVHHELIGQISGHSQAR